jgi:hypothetical protein
MLAGGSTIASANLITNPDFTSTAGWVFNGDSGTEPWAGDTAAFVNCFPSCYLDDGASQSIAQGVGTGIGETYSVGFSLSDNGAELFGTGGQVSVAFGNTTWYLTTPYPDSGTWEQYTFSSTATSATTDFTFASQALLGGTFFITDVSVTPGAAAIPEPSTLFTGVGVLLAAVLLRKRRAASRT